MIDTVLIYALVWIVGTLISIVIFYHYEEKVTLAHVLWSVIGWYAVLFSAFVLFIAWLIVTVGELCGKIVLFEKKTEYDKIEQSSWLNEVTKKKDNFNDIKKK